MVADTLRSILNTRQDVLFEALAFLTELFSCITEHEHVCPFPYDREGCLDCLEQDWNDTYKRIPEALRPLYEKERKQLLECAVLILRAGLKEDPSP